MTDPLDTGLGKLRGISIDHDLGALESAVWARVEKRSQADVFGGRMLSGQIAVTAMALITGYAVSEFVSVPGTHVQSEIAVLSDAIAPSIRLEGGV